MCGAADLCSTEIRRWDSGRFAREREFLLYGPNARAAPVKVQFKERLSQV